MLILGYMEKRPLTFTSTIYWINEQCKSTTHNDNYAAYITKEQRHNIIKQKSYLHGNKYIVSMPTISSIMTKMRMREFKS